MNKASVGFFFAFAACAAFGDTIDDDFAEYGGALNRKGSYEGKVTLVNCQKDLHVSNVVAVAKLMEEMLEIRFETVSADFSTPDELMKKLGAKVLVAVISDKTQPTMLLAPEDRWCVVNLTKLVDDLPAVRAKKKFFEPRARKEIIKAATLVCGGGSSQYPGNIMNTATVRELDRVKEMLPADKIASCVEYLKKLGITQKEIVTYEDACQEGWAPAPTNAIQKAIWDKIHQLPTKPIKITPEAKPVKK